MSDKKALFTGLFDGDSDTVLFDRSASFLAKLEKLVDVDSEPEELDDEEDEDGEVLADAGEEMDALDDESAAGPNHIRSGMEHAQGPEAAATASAPSEAEGSIASSVGAAASKTPPEPDMYPKDSTFLAIRRALLLPPNPLPFRRTQWKRLRIQAPRAGRPSMPRLTHPNRLHRRVPRMRRPSEPSHVAPNHHPFLTAMS